jgi:hypothetical protein
MKCSHPMCKRGIGLVSYRRAFGTCRTNYAGERLGALSLRSADARLFAWLFAAPSEGGHPTQVPAAIRVRTP